MSPIVMVPKGGEEDCWREVGLGWKGGGGLGGFRSVVDPETSERGAKKHEI